MQSMRGWMKHALQANNESCYPTEKFGHPWQVIAYFIGFLCMYRATIIFTDMTSQQNNLTHSISGILGTPNENLSSYQTSKKIYCTTKWQSLHNGSVQNWIMTWCAPSIRKKC